MALLKDILISIGIDKNSATEVAKSFDTIKNYAQKTFQAIAAVSTGIGGIATIYARYEANLVNVGKVTNLTGEALKSFGQEIRNLSKTMPTTTNDLLAIAQAGAQVGVANEDLKKFTETIAKLAASSNITGDVAAVALTRILTLTKEGVKDIDKFASAIVGLGSASLASESEIVGTATRVSQSIARFNVSSTEILGLSTALASLGIEAENSGTSMQFAFNGISEAIYGGGKSLEVLQKITGLTGAQLKKTFETDATQVFLMFLEGLKRVSEQDFPKVLEQFGLSGARANAVIGTLSNNLPVLQGFLKQANDEVQRGDTLNRQYAAVQETLASRFQTLKNLATDLAISIGEKTVDSFIKLIEKGKAFINSLRPEDIQRISEEIADFTQALASLGEMIGTVIKGVAKLYELSKQVGQALVGGTAAIYDSIFGKTQTQVDILNKQIDDLEKRREQLGREKYSNRNYSTEMKQVEEDIAILEKAKGYATAPRSAGTATASTSTGLYTPVNQSFGDVDAALKMAGSKSGGASAAPSTGGSAGVPKGNIGNLGLGKDGKTINSEGEILTDIQTLAKLEQNNPYALLTPEQIEAKKKFLEQQNADELSRRQQMDLQLLTQAQKQQEELRKVQQEGIVGQFTDLKDFFTKSGDERRKNQKNTVQAETELYSQLNGLAMAAAQKNKTLAYAFAVIKTAAGVARALSDYPFPYSVAIGSAVAAAGALQIGTIAKQGFQAGGLVTGGIKGVDSVNIMAQQGELITPPQNYEEHIQAVIRQRGYVRAEDANGISGSGGVISIELKGQAAQYINAEFRKNSDAGIRG